VQRSITLRRLLPHPVERVWRALTDPEQLGAWFMANDFAPALGHAFTFRMPPQRGWDGVTHCEVVELAPPSRVAFSYRGRATGEKTLACAGVASETAMQAAKGVFTELDTVLRFTLEPATLPGGGEGTRFTLHHAGFRGLKLVVVSLVMGAGWKKIVDRRLPEVLDRLASADDTLPPEVDTP